MGSLDFAAQYQQSPVPPEGNLIRWRWFGINDDPPRRDGNDRIIVSWDTASSSKDLSCYSVGIVAQVCGDRPNQTVHVLDVIREQLEYPELRRKVIAVHRRWQNYCSKYSLLIEDKGSGMSLIQDLKQVSDVNPVAIVPKGEKMMRMAAQCARIENGSVFLPREAPWLVEFQKELMAFPRGQSDDQVDALSQLLAFLSDPRLCHVGWGTYIGHI